MEIRRTSSDNPDFIALVKQLDAFLAITDGDEHAFYNQFNSIKVLKYVLIVYVEGKAVGCGAIKEVDSQTVEIKRMFVLSETRGKGIASLILKTLEDWTQELNYNQCILETGLRQLEAIALYKKCNYTITVNYGQYIGVKNSMCFSKKLVK